MKRTDIINNIIIKYNFNTYLEIGIKNPDGNFNKIQCEDKISVDPHPLGDVDYKCTSDEFFNINEKNFDLIFIDGFHEYTQVMKDIYNSIKILNESGFIIVHDCCPHCRNLVRSYEHYKKFGGDWCGDVYKGFIEAKYKLNNYNCFVIDTDYGVGIITKNDFGFDNICSSLNNITYEFFYENRHDLLNLISSKAFKELIR